MRTHWKSAVCLALLAFAGNACGGRGGSKIERSQQQYGVVQESQASGVSTGLGDTAGTTTPALTGTNKDSSSNFAVVNGTPVSTDIVPTNGQPAGSAPSAAATSTNSAPNFGGTAAPSNAAAPVVAARTSDGRIAIVQAPSRTSTTRRSAPREQPATDTRAPESREKPTRATTDQSTTTDVSQTATNPNPPAASETTHSDEPKPAPATDSAAPTDTAPPPPPPTSTSGEGSPRA
jgi:hypothetical protein